MSGLRAGLCSVTFRGRSPDEVVAAAVAAGLDGIEWGADVHVPPGELDVAREVREHCHDAGLAVPSYGSYLAAGKSDPAEVAPVLASAAALGAANVRVWCPFGAPPGSDDDLARAAAADLAAWAAMAADRGLTLSTEFHVGTFTETAASTLALLDDAGRPDNLFTYWQPVAGRLPLEEASAVRDAVSHVHVFHWRPDGERRPLAEGAEEGEWPAVLDALARPTRFAGERYAFLEFVRDDDPDQLRRDAATLRSWLGGRP